MWPEFGGKPERESWKSSWCGCVLSASSASPAPDFSLGPLAASRVVLGFPRRDLGPEALEALPRSRGKIGRSELATLARGKDGAAGSQGLSRPADGLRGHSSDKPLVERRQNRTGAKRG